MKKYFTVINDSPKKNEIEMMNKSQASVNGRVYDYEFEKINNNVFVLRLNGKNYFLSVTDTEDTGLLSVNIDSVDYKLSCKSETDLLLEGMIGSKGSNRIKKEIKSPMPGIIKSLNILPGQSVKKGEVLLVLEAMKMENEIKSVMDGVIKKVNVEAMSSVEKNELLMEFE